MSKHEKKFYDALADLFVGSEVEGKSGYVNLMKIKNAYYQKIIKPKLQEYVNEKLGEKLKDFMEELYEKLYTFFKRYFSENGSIYYTYTAWKDRVYERIYSAEEDVSLFWKTHMLYYVKTDQLYKSLEIKVQDGQRNEFVFYIDVSELKHKKANEKKQLVYEFKEIDEKGRIVLGAFLSERGKKTKVEAIVKEIKKRYNNITSDLVEKAIRTFEKQSEIDFFINKDAEKFLKEQFDIYLYQYIFSKENVFSQKRINELRVLKDVAYKVIDFIAQFENELVKIWNKPRFVLDSNYVITVDRIWNKGEKGKDVLKKIVEELKKQKNRFEEDIEKLNFSANDDKTERYRKFLNSDVKNQIVEWYLLGIIDENFDVDEVLTRSDLFSEINKKWQFLPIDTKYFKDLEPEILELFDNLDEELDGWLIHSENYQALNTILPKWKKQVQTIYIDPPYNAENTSEIPYVNNYKDSSWLTMMENRLSTAKFLLSLEGVLVIAIDENEQENLGLILKKLFENFIITCVVIRHNKKGIQGKYFSYNHEYAYFVISENLRSINEIPIPKEKWEYSNLRNWGSESLRTDARNCFYPIYVKNGEIIGAGDVCPDEFHPISSNATLEDGVVAIYPIDKNGVERKWRYARNSFEKIKDLLRVKHKNGKIEIEIPKVNNKFKTFWDDAKYIAGDFGTKLLTDMGIKGYFDFPKSVYTVKDSIFAVSSKKSIVLDFFAGSGTTAHAVMKLNKEDEGKRKFILIEMADYFNTVIIPRLKKIAYSFDWKNGRPRDADGISTFFKYYSLEQYEDILRKAKYKESEDLFLTPGHDEFTEYIFMRDPKLVEDVVSVDSEESKVKVSLSNLYERIDIAETLSNVLGKKIKQIKNNGVVFEDGENVSFDNIPVEYIKPLIWW